MEVQPRQDVETAEARADMSRSSARDHVKRVDSTQIRENRSLREGLAFERQRPRLAAVPGLICRILLKQRLHALTGYQPHLSGMLSAPFDRSQRVDARICRERRPRALNRGGLSKRTRWPQQAEAIELAPALAQ